MSEACRISEKHKYPPEESENRVQSYWDPEKLPLLLQEISKGRLYQGESFLMNNKIILFIVLTP